MPDESVHPFASEWTPVGATHVQSPHDGVGRWMILMARFSLEDGVEYQARAESDLPEKPADRDAIPVGSTHNGSESGTPDWVVLVAWHHPELGWQFGETTPDIAEHYNRAEESPVQVR